MLRNKDEKHRKPYIASVILFASAFSGRSRLEISLSGDLDFVHKSFCHCGVRYRRIFSTVSDLSLLIPSMSREPDLLYLFLGSDKNVQLLHHVDLLGNPKTPNFTPVGLCGMKTPSQVIKFDLTDFITFHMCVPVWQNFENGLVDIDHFKSITLEPTAAEDVQIAALIANGSTEVNANLTRAHDFQHSNVIAIPLGLSSAVIETDIREYRTRRARSSFMESYNDCGRRTRRRNGKLWPVSNQLLSSHLIPLGSSKETSPSTPICNPGGHLGQ